MAVGENSNISLLVTYMEDPDRVPDGRLQPGPALAVESI